MSMNYRNVVRVIAVLALVSIATAVQANVILFSDNFDGANNAVDYGLNDNLAARQAGATLGIVPWALDHITAASGTPAYNQACIQVNSTGAPNRLLLQNVDTTTNNNNFRHAVLIQNDFAASSEISTTGGFTVRFTLNPMTAGISGQDTRGLDFFMGALDGTQSTMTNVTPKNVGSFNSDADLSLFFRNNGTVYTKSHDVGATANTGTFDSARAGNYDRAYTFEVRVETVDFLQNTVATAQLWMGAPGTASNLLTQVDIDGNAANGTTSYSFTWDANQKCYMGFSPYYPRLDASGWVDDVSVFTADVPEPSTLALLACGLIGLLAYAWRKRK